MAGVNGRADIVGPPIELGDFLPERRVVVLNGQEYTAWVTTNRRYPRHIMARLDKIARHYNRVILPLLNPLEEGQPPDAARLEAAEEQPEAWSEYVTHAVLLLIPSLQESELELVDLEVLENLLRHLGYFPPLPETAGDTADTAEETEAPAASAGDPLSTLPTGDSPPPDLLVSTPGPVPTSS